MIDVGSLVKIVKPDNMSVKDRVLWNTAMDDYVGETTKVTYRYTDDLLEVECDFGMNYWKPEWLVETVPPDFVLDEAVARNIVR